MVFQPFKNRENIEWTNTWIESCNNPDTRRFLFIGDSVAREMRSELSKMLPQYAYDYIGTSSSFEDPCFYNIFDAFFKNNLYTYQTIFCNIGAKHFWYMHTARKKQDAQRYTKEFSMFLNYLQQYCKKIVILSVTPNKYSSDFTKWDEDVNEEILKRNEIQADIAAKESIPVVDLYSLVMEKQYAYRDHCHFKDRSATQEIVAFSLKNHPDFTDLLPALPYVGQNIQAPLSEKNNSVRKYKIFSFLPLFSIEEE